MNTPSPQVAAAAQVLAADLEFSVPWDFAGPDGWYAVAAKALAAAEEADRA